MKKKVVLLIFWVERPAAGFAGHKASPSASRCHYSSLFRMNNLRIIIFVIQFITLSTENILGQANSSPILTKPFQTRPIYDLYDSAQKTRSGKTFKVDSIFNWLVGKWTVSASGYAKEGFRNKKSFTWTEAPRRIFFDNNYTFFVQYLDSVSTIYPENARQTILAIPGVLLQLDRASNIWVLKDGFDWGSEIATSITQQKITFTGTISLAGLKINERQVWTKISASSFRVDCYDILKGGTVFLSETNIYTKL